MTQIPPLAPSGPECSLRLVDADKVEAVRSRMPGDSDVADLAVIFGLLSDPGRVRILIALLEGEMCVCDLAATTGLSESGVSHALRLLRGPRVVQVRRSGRMAYYSLADSHVRMLLDLGLTHVGHTGKDRLRAVETAQPG
ncbi:ArsR/SmtB family transcription factor [Pseudarthrobacter sp. NPDC092184]|jgi:DNA-binding transcriptional ArsR family regulator|uniref:ArsR/SmtB family transcription factor n=1 Tax=Pseudarthrobacter TaxID=1742993 RepID=UPI00168AD04A|nr:metalloregulator ArsR/SmtB family transcription factor [Pseudarthrobacter sp. BIM B-2242]QOD02010.1 helix-turn-helix transcriptional regulator [Pseudarthrobacter sp. BIM B-2242]BFE45644.1 metalloregulator ArsR/SmtB family transcription factor [Pseudarthrobacter oxydans]